MFPAKQRPRFEIPEIRAGSLVDPGSGPKHQNKAHFLTGLRGVCQDIRSDRDFLLRCKGPRQPDSPLPFLFVEFCQLFLRQRIPRPLNKIAAISVFCGLFDDVSEKETLFLDCAFFTDHVERSDYIVQIL